MGLHPEDKSIAFLIPTVEMGNRAEGGVTPKQDRLETPLQAGPPHNHRVSPVPLRERGKEAGRFSTQSTSEEFARLTSRGP